VLAFTVTEQTFQAVSRRNPQVLHIFRRVKKLKLSQGRTLYRSVNTLDIVLMPDTFSVFAAERSGHVTIV
jgi:hypothetical protein